jgi:muramidase (phage lysozyme)
VDPFGGLPPQAYKLLNTIAGTESPGYDVMYGGKRFSGYVDHPRVAVPIGSGPNAGRTSTAAGRYQFLAPTWDQQARKLGLKDFSPQNQDVAAWDLAKTAYGKNTGRDLERDLMDPSQLGRIATSLSGTWTSLPGGIEQAGGGNDRFSRAFQNAAATGVAPAGASDYGISSPQVSASTPRQPTFNPFAAASAAPTAPKASTVTRGKTPNLADVFSQNLILSS